MALTVLNPATEEPIAELEQADVDEADAAVARAKAAYPAWSAVAPADRARLLRRLATLVEENAEDLARIESQNVGKPIAGARGENRDGRAGHAVTGSTEVGRLVMQGAAGTIKRVTLELGGKSANVIFEDADLERSAAAAPYSVFDNAGQDCCARSRILVQRSVYDRFLDLLVDATRSVKVGDPSDESTEMGPLVSAAHRETVASFVDGEPTFRGDVPDGPGTGIRAPRRGVGRGSRRARGGVRPRCCRHPVRGRSGRDPHLERHAVRSLGIDLDA